MKRIGIVGGTGPESTVAYYQHIIKAYYERFGDYAFPEMIIYSVNFQRFVDLFQQARWDSVAEGVIQTLDRLRRAGADFGILASNTLHIAFERVVEHSPLPLLSIMDPAIEAIQHDRMDTVGLLGTIFTMSESFYPSRLAEGGIRTLVPGDADQQRIQKIIGSELTMGEIRKESKDVLLRIIHGLKARGARGIILGCTELPLILSEKESPLPLFDTTRLHAESALNHALN